MEVTKEDYRLAEEAISLRKFDEAVQILRKTAPKSSKALDEGYVSTMQSEYLLAYALIGLGQEWEAEEILQTLVQRSSNGLGDEHVDTLSFKELLSQALLGQRKDEEAEQILRVTIQQFSKVLGAKHPQTLSVKELLGRALLGQGKYEGAEQILRETVQQCSEVLGEEHSQTLSVKTYLSQSLIGQEKDEEVEQILREIVKLRSRILGDEHLDTLVSKNRLALALIEQQRAEDAELILREVVQQKSKVLGEEHISTVGSKRILAIALFDQERYGEAEQILRETVLRDAEALGEGSLHTLASKQLLAQTLTRQRKYKEAENILQDTIQRQLEKSGAEHTNTLASNKLLAEALIGQRKYKESVLRDTAQKGFKTSGTAYIQPLASEELLAQALAGQERYEEAEEILRDTAENLSETLGVEHITTLANRQLLAEALIGQQKYEEAEQILRFTTEKQLEKLGEGNSNALTGMQLLAGALIGQQKYEAVEQSLRNTIEKLSTRLGIWHTATQVSKQLLASTLIVKQEYEEAEQILLALVEEQSEILNAGNFSTLLSKLLLANALKGEQRYEEAMLVLHEVEQTDPSGAMHVNMTLSKLLISLTSRGLQNNVEMNQNLHETSQEQLKLLLERHIDTLTSEQATMVESVPQYTTPEGGNDDWSPSPTESGSQARPEAINLVHHNQLQDQKTENHLQTSVRDAANLGSSLNGQSTSASVVLDDENFTEYSSSEESLDQLVELANPSKDGVLASDDLGSDYPSQDLRFLNPHAWRSGLENLEQKIAEGSLTITNLKERATSGCTSWVPYISLEDTNELILRRFAGIQQNIRTLQVARYSTTTIPVLILGSDRPGIAKLKLIDVTMDSLSKLQENLFSQTFCSNFLSEIGLSPGDTYISPREYSALVVAFLDLAIVSFSGAHLEPFDSKYIGWTVDGIDVRDIFALQRRRMRCLDGYLTGQHVWVFHDRGQMFKGDSDDPLYLSTRIDDFAILWGPVWSSSLPNGGPVIKYNVGAGSFIPWPRATSEPEPEDDETFCHWTRDAEQIAASDQTFADNLDDTTQEPFKTRLLIGGLLTENPCCTFDSRQYKASKLDTNCLHPIGAHHLTYVLDGQAVGGQIGGFGISTGYTETYKRRGAPFRDDFLASWKNEAERRDLNVLRHRFVVEISICTENARRQRLSYVMASQAMRNYLASKDPPIPWPGPACQEEYIRCLRRNDIAQLRQHFEHDDNCRKACFRAMAESIVVLLESGVNEHNLLTALYVPTAEESYTVTFQCWDYSWSGVLKEGTSDLNLAILTDRCLELDHPRMPLLLCKNKGVTIENERYTILETRLLVNSKLSATGQPSGLRLIKNEDNGASDEEYVRRWSVRKLRDGEIFDMGMQGKLHVVDVFRAIRRLGTPSGIITGWSDLTASRFKHLKQHAREKAGFVPISLSHHEVVWELGGHPVPPILIHIASHPRMARQTDD